MQKRIPNIKNAALCLQEGIPISDTLLELVLIRKEMRRTSSEYHKPHTPNECWGLKKKLALLKKRRDEIVLEQTHLDELPDLVWNGEMLNVF